MGIFILGWRGPLVVGGLAFMGYMDLASQYMYGNRGATVTNVVMGVASAVIDNIPVMF